MSYPAAAIRTAIAELLTGTIGSVRTVAALKMAAGVFDGQPMQTQRALGIQTTVARHRFDVQVGQLRNNPSTPLSNRSSFRISDLDITILVTSAVSPVSMRTQRETDLALIATDMETACQALAKPGNLTQTNAAVATNLLGGCLYGPGALSTPTVERAIERWDNNEQLVRTVITARGTLQITQAVA